VLWKHQPIVPSCSTVPLLKPSRPTQSEVIWSSALQVTLGAGERRELEQKPTDDVEAYQLYLKGRHAAETLADWDTAIRYLQQAIARDPGFALAYDGLAFYYTLIADWGMPGNEALPRAREAAEKALRLRSLDGRGAHLAGRCTLVVRL